jgi:hypothetical protein
MSEAASVPFSETKAPQSPDRLHRGAFPYAALGIVVVSVIYAIVLNQRDRTLGDRVGSIVADD